MWIYTKTPNLLLLQHQCGGYICARMKCRITTNSIIFTYYGKTNILKVALSIKKGGTMVMLCIAKTPCKVL